jgi:uncharacterized lipoprotein YmbA
MNALRTRGLTRLAVIVLAALVASCASSPAPRYFRLEVPAGLNAIPGSGASDLAVVVGPFQLAEYLDRPQIVTREGENGIAMADYERWAEPLDANFQSVVAASVGRLLGSDRVLEFPAAGILKADRRVTGRISRLDVDGNGLAVLEVQWGVLDGAGAAVRPGGVSRYEAQVRGEGAAARVAALNATVAAFSVDLSAAVR